MIQKTITKIAASVLFFLLFVSASKPSLDGRAVVAPQEELPPGLYVKSAAFLPGDTVLITNPAAKVSIEALVFASFSASDGIAVVLSPEAAKLLFIERGSNSIVQVTKNGGDMELSVLSKAYDALPLNEEPAVEAVGAIEDAQPDRPAEVAETDEVPAESASEKSELAEAQPAETEDVPAEEVPAEIAAADEVPAESEGTNEETALAEVQPAEAEEVPAEEVPAEIAAADEVPAESEEITEDIVEVAAAPVAEEDSAEPEIPADIEDKSEETALVEAQPAETEDVPAEEVPAEIAEAEEESAEPEIPADNEDKNEETALAEAQPAETEDMPAEEVPVEVAEAEEAPAEEVPAEIAAADEVPAESEEVTHEAEEPVNEPNVLIAAEDNPPENTESVFDEPIVETAVANDTGDTETLPDYFAHVQEVPEKVSAEPVPVETPHTKAIDSNAFAARNENLERYIIQNVREFGKGTYCIQLATYKDPANIAGFIEKYADKYPVRLASSEKIGGAYQVLIGPLNKDEYPVVLKRFVAWGFKDAFLREIR